MRGASRLVPGQNFSSAGKMDFLAAGVVVPRSKPAEVIMAVEQTRKVVLISRVGLAAFDLHDEMSN
jgi:hypothetical protein